MDEKEIKGKSVIFKIDFDGENLELNSVDNVNFEGVYVGKEIE